MIANVDALVINFDVKNYDTTIQKYLNILEMQKDLSRQYLYDNQAQKSHIVLGNIDYEVLPNGARCYAYLLHNDLIELRLAKGRSKNKNTYPIVVKYKSTILWEKGLNAYFYASDFIEELFGQIINTMVSRVDLAYHTDGLNFQVCDLDKFVGKYRKDSLHRCDRKIETFYFGSRKTQTVMCRIYNKTRQLLEERKSLWFIDIWSKYDLDITNVWNVEYELHREFLKQIDIDTFEQLVDNIKGIWGYLTHNWIRYVDISSATRSNNYKIFEVWQKVQNGYDAFSMDGEIEREVQRLRDANKYVPSAVGYLTSLSALVNIDEVDDALEYLRFQMDKYFREKKNSTFNEVVTNKKRYYTKIRNDINEVKYG